MIRRKASLALLLTLFLSLPVAEAMAANHVYRLFVDGLACPFCAYGVEKKVGGLDGVEKVEIDISGGVVAVTLTEGAVLDEAMARKAIEEAGFSLRKFEPPNKGQRN